MANQFLINPNTGDISFGHVPEMTTRGVVLPEGGIRLLQGRHRGPNRGFGAAHIWEEHAQEMAALGLTSLGDVPAYVAAIIQQGTPLYFSAETMRQTRIIAVRARTGMAVLEYKDRRDAAIWSVVTAYSKTQTHGTRVGTVR